MDGGFIPIFSAGFRNPNIPIVEFINTLPDELANSFISPCKRLLGIDRSVAKFEVKLLVPFLIG